MQLSRAERAKFCAQFLVASPKQEDIDAVAHFVEAVQELRASPSFVEEFSNLRIRSWQGASNKEFQGDFPNPIVVEAMLIPFRRLWQPGQPCFYRRVAKILKKYEPKETPWIDEFTFTNKKSMLSRWSLLNPQELSPSDIIDLWLNTRYMHTGMSRRCGKFTRKDFEHHEQRMGKVLFEYYFLQAVHEVAVSFFNLGKCCEGFLLACEGRGLQPSFKMREPLQAGVLRATPGLTIRGDSPADRLWRLKRRRRHQAVATFLSLTDLSDERLAKAVSTVETFDELLQALGITIEQREEIVLQKDNSIISMAGIVDSIDIVLQRRKPRTGWIAKNRSGRLCSSGDCVAILRDQFMELRNALLREPFV